MSAGGCQILTGFRMQPEKAANAGVADICVTGIN